MTTAGIYVRISRDREGGGLGVARQERECRDKAGLLGWSVARVYCDNDLSAASGRARPAYGRMLADVESGRVDAIVAWHADRLHRRPAEMEHFIELVERHGVAIATVTAGDLDLSTPSGRMVARMLGAAARYEVDQTRDRIRAKAMELAKAGRNGGGGSRPFGFNDDRVTLREPEAALIRDGASRLLAGESVRGIARDWASTPTVGGAGWTTHVVRRLMRSARIAGLREHNGVVTSDAEWPAIIDRATHERLRRLLDDPARNRRGAGAGRKYLLSGLAECSLCGKKLISRPSQRREYGTVERTPSMVCASGPPFHGCGKIRIRAECLEGLVSEAVILRLDGPALNRLVRSREESGREAELQKALDEDRDALGELARDRYERRTITDREFHAARPGLLARIERNERLLAEAADKTVLADVPTGEGALARAWPAWTVDRRRAVIDAVVERLVVKPGVRGRNRYTPEQLAERVEIEWADELRGV